MRVLFVTHSFPRWKGDVAGAFILRLARALADGGTGVSVLAPAAPGLAAEDVLDGIPVCRFRYAPGAWQTLAYTGTMAEQVGTSWRGKAALAGMVLRGARALSSSIASARADVVHAHWWFPAGLMAWWAGRGAPIVTTLHGSDVRLARTSRWAPALFRRVVQRSGAVTAVSRWLAEQAQTMAPGLETAVAPMPADVTLFEPGSAPRHAARFLFVGRLNRQKGIGILLEALAITEGATLDVVGDGPERGALEARSRGLGIAERVAWLGTRPQADLVSFYRAATAVVIPSEHEGLGLVAIEAHLCEAPVIAFRSGGITDIVADGGTGLLVPPSDVRALARAMQSLLERSDRGTALGRAGRLGALARFAPAVVAARYRAIYDEVAARVA